MEIGSPGLRITRFREVPDGRIYVEAGAARPGGSTFLSLCWPRPLEILTVQCTHPAQGASILDTLPCGRGTQERARLFRRAERQRARRSQTRRATKGLLSNRSSWFTTSEAVVDISRTRALATVVRSVYRPVLLHSEKSVRFTASFGRFAFSY